MSNFPIPSNAPFSDAQRQWLGSLFGGLATPNSSASAPVVVTPIAAPPTESEPETAPVLQAAYDRANPFPATIKEVRALSRKDSEKDVRFVSFDLRGSGLTYEVGDALGVYPENCPELVSDLLEVLEATGEEPVLAPEGKIIPLRVALLNAYVINEVSEDTLQLLARKAADPNESQKLLALCDNDSEGYDLLDILREFASARPQRKSDIAEIVASLSVLRPRLYSISSSQKAHEDEVHLTVGMVRYRREGCERVRKGVASTFLGERLHAGQKAAIFVQESHGFRPPRDASTRMIMVGPGTGIAPFRAFLEEREVTGARGENWLFFGDQRSECDYLYRTEMEAWRESGLLTKLDLAWSRDGMEKVYVQHKMLEHGAELWQWLNGGAHFYVCGDARRMARDVDAALQNIVSEHGKMSPQEAKAYLATMTREGRYGRDVY
jgi:sulfite reductase (NADPH) flavoprotein alpha-component